MGLPKVPKLYLQHGCEMLNFSQFLVLLWDRQHGCEMLNFSQFLLLLWDRFRSSLGILAGTHVVAARHMLPEPPLPPVLFVGCALANEFFVMEGAVSSLGKNIGIPAPSICWAYVARA